MERKFLMRKRINVQFMALAASAILIIAAVSMILFYNTLKTQVFGDLKSYAEILARLEEKWELSSYEFDGELRITLIEEDGTVAYDSYADAETLANHGDRPEVAAAKEKGEGWSVRTSQTMEIHAFYYATLLPDGRILRVAKNSAGIYQLWRTILIVVLILAALVLGGCMVISYFLTKRLLIPIERLAVNLDGISMDNVYAELQPFVKTIKEQHINLVDSAKMRQEFTANVSHELKTPLTAISGYAELIESGMVNEADTKRFAGEIHRNSQRLLTLINDILKLSELDENDADFEVEQIDLYEAARTCLSTMELSARKADVSLSLQGESATIVANKTLIDELLYNLCSNAVRYNNRGGSVTVTVRREEKGTLLSVADTGIGIAKEHQERVFERFYRVDKSRSKQSGGTGLGLAIVKHIVAQQNAKLSLTSEVGKGTEIRILFS